MPLERIGFYTLSDARAASASATTRLSRCELILSSKCNFACPYCRSVGGPNMAYADAESIVRGWAAENLFAIRFSGGEPLMYPGLLDLVVLAKSLGIERIAISSNGSYPLHKYKELLAAGVNDLSISLDACCAEEGDRMAGGVKGAWDIVTSNIRELSKLTYVTVGVVLTDANSGSVNDIIRFAASLGVGDIRVIPAAQDSDRLRGVVVDEDILTKYPILRYRIENLQNGRPVRGLREGDSHQCGLVMDDMAVAEGKHYPCIIYMREGGAPIGSMSDPNVREDRAAWSRPHDTHADPICRGQCLDVCVSYNNTFEAAHGPADRSAHRHLPVL